MTVPASPDDEDQGRSAPLAGWAQGPAPRLEPLAYPGRRPPRSVLLTDGGLLPLDLEPGRPLPFDGRTPVLAVGSNASPAQLLHKFASARVSPVVPLVAAEVTGLAAGVAAFVARAGYVPAAPVLAPGLRDDLFVQWLDDAQLARLDATEPNYRRVRLTADDGVRITLASGDVLDACDVYACSHGHLAPGGTPRRLDHDQAALLVELLAASSRLRSLMGDTPATWIARATEPGIADGVRAVFRAEGWVAFCL